jgi:hypothetical protein
MIAGYVMWAEGSLGVQVIVVFQELREQASQSHSHHPERRLLGDSLVQNLEVPGYLRRCGEPEDPFW